MKIGLDVDGVLTDLEGYQLKYGKKYFLKRKPNLKINAAGYDICDIFHCTKSEREKFWTKYIWGYCMEKTVAGAAEMVARLRAEGHEIHIITGRAHTTEAGPIGELFRKMLISRLKKDGVEYESIHFVSESGSALDKVKICEELGIDVMIDDKKENVEALDGKLDIICKDAAYNQGIRTQNYTRVFSIDEIYDELEKLSAKYTKEGRHQVFQVLTHEERQGFSDEELKKYFSELRKFQAALPYDSKKMKKQERRYRIVAKIGGAIFKIVYNPNIFNPENFQCEGSAIYVANHNNYYDQFPIITAIGDKPIHFLTATKMLKLKRGFFYKLTGAVSVDREDKSDRKRATEDIEKIIIHGGTVFIFPAGRTNREKVKILPFQPGAAAIAQATGAPIIPIAVNDNYKRGQLCVRAGKKLYVSPTDDIIEKTQAIQDTVEGLIDENDAFLKEKSLRKRKKA